MKKADDIQQLSDDVSTGPTPLNRRDFLKKTAGAGAAIIAGPALLASSGSSTKNSRLPEANEPFKLKYAPGLGMFREHAGKDVIDIIKFCHDMGFRAVFDNGIMNKPVELQEKIASELTKLGMDLGPFVLYADFKVTSFVLDKPEVKEMLQKKMMRLYIMIQHLPLVFFL